MPSVHGDAALLDRPDVTGWARLHTDEPATMLRNDEGRMLLTDGPFIDSKEYLAGLFLIEADNLDGALAIAQELQADLLSPVRCALVQCRGGIGTETGLGVSVVRPPGGRQELIVRYRGLG